MLMLYSAKAMLEEERKGREGEKGGKKTYSDFATVEIGYRSVEITYSHEENALAYG